ncbi:MAG: aldo/keto reductase [Candidatus Aminicenantes bacterium]|nr:aldo/keto reductase [Candidatus Aminicenantes bacterium]
MSRPDLKRRSFLKLGLTGLAAAGAVPSAAHALASTGLPQAGGQTTAPQPKRIFRTLGRTGLKLPVVSMGVMNADNPNLVQAALDRGILLLDTAYGYQRGRNEQMIGQVIKGRPRDSYFIATKIPSPARGRDTRSLSEAEAMADFLGKFDTSLGRLGLDYVDILSLHNVDKREAALYEPVLKALTKAKKEGKARFVGVTTHGNEPEVLRAAAESGVYDVVINAFNFRQDHRSEVSKAMAEAVKAGLGIIAMKTQAGAFWDREKQQPINMTAALKWALADPSVTTAIPGFTTFDQLETDLAVMNDLRLTEQELKDLRFHPETGGLYCQQCGQCLPACPPNLPLPDLMRSYMYAYGYRNLEAAHDLVTSLELPDSPCRDCAVCGVRCAKGFDVAGRVRDIVRLRALPGDLFA